MRLADKVALVTGGSRSIGRAIALGLAREGADVAINYRASKDEADSAVREMVALGRRAVAVRANTSDAQQVRAMVTEVVAQSGRIDILVNNAGVLKRTPFLELSEEEWDRVLDVNLKGYFLSARRSPARWPGAAAAARSSTSPRPASSSRRRT